MNQMISMKSETQRRHAYVLRQEQNVKRVADVPGGRLRNGMESLEGVDKQG